MANLITGEQELDRFFANATGSMQRQVLRGATAAGGTVLAKQIRKNIVTMAGTRTPQQRKGRPPLRRTIIKKYWSKPRSGVIGHVVGAKYGKGGGPHAHLVERGHRTRRHGRGWLSRRASGKFTGGRTRPIPFQERAAQQVFHRVYQAQLTYAKTRLTKMVARAKGM